MSIVPVASLDWPEKDDDPLLTVTVQCAGDAFLDYEARRLEQRLFHHGSSFLDDDDEDDDDDGQESSLLHQGNLLEMEHDELEEMTYYQVLHIPMHSTAEQIKRAYHRACLKYHPDKTGRGEEDEVFLKVKAAFDTLSDISKRKSYDSMIDFDDSIPKGGEQVEQDFYDVYGPVFERNLRFDMHYDPERQPQVKDNSSSKRGKKGRSAQKNASMKPPPPTLGNDDTSMDKVHAFYEHWIHFESWRDFTLRATEQIEGNYDPDNADSRYEKRYYTKEIDKKAKAMKREEMARINTLVERAMAADPRLKRERLRKTKEKERLAQEKKQRHEEAKQKEAEEMERLAKEHAAREAAEREQKAAAKANKEKEKKQLRRARQLLRKLTLSAFQQVNNGDDMVWNSLEDCNDDVELLCSELSAVQITELTDALGGDGDDDGANDGVNIKVLPLVKQRAAELKEEKKEESLDAAKRREDARKAAAAKAEKAKAAKASSPWTKEELSALGKAVKKYPPGGSNRWETIAHFVNNLCKPVDPRTKEECIEKFNQIAQQSGPGGGPMSRQSSTVSETKSEKASTTKTNGVSTPSAAWSEEQDKQLQAGLAKYPATMDKNERWTAIAKGVTGKGKKDCVQRFKAIREAIKKK